MKQEKIIAKVLDPKRLKRLPNSPVVDVRWHPYVDTMGIDSLRVWVIIKESVTDEELLSGIMRPIHAAIHDGLREAGIQLFPFIRIAKASDVAELGLKI